MVIDMLPVTFAICAVACAVLSMSLPRDTVVWGLSTFITALLVIAAIYTAA